MELLNSVQIIWFCNQNKPWWLDARSDLTFFSNPFLYLLSCFWSSFSISTSILVSRIVIVIWSPHHRYSRTIHSEWAVDSDSTSNQDHPAGNHSRSLLRSIVPLPWQQDLRTYPDDWWNDPSRPDGLSLAGRHCYFSGLVLSSRSISITGNWLKADPYQKPISLSSL